MIDQKEQGDEVDRGLLKRHSETNYLILAGIVQTPPELKRCKHNKNYKSCKFVISLCLLCFMSQCKSCWDNQCLWLQVQQLGRPECLGKDWNMVRGSWPHAGPKFWNFLPLSVTFSYFLENFKSTLKPTSLSADFPILHIDKETGFMLFPLQSACYYPYTYWVRGMVE